MNEAWHERDARALRWASPLAAIAAALLGASACAGRTTGLGSEKERDDGQTHEGGSAQSLENGSTGQSGTGGGSDGPGCTAACCPQADICYVDGPSGVGAECLAVRDNSRGVTSRIQMRQTWVRATLPLGTSPGDFVGDMAYETVARRSQLPLPECNPVDGSRGDLGGHIQLVDLDLDRGVSRVGYAQFVTDGEAAVADGLCLAAGRYQNPAYALAGPFYDWSERPAGLRPPMSAPFQVGPVTARRVSEDFDIQDPGQRAAILEELESAPDYDSIFFFDDETGTSHGYSPLQWVVYYDSANSYIAVPLREAETRSRFNDPETRSCVGAYRAGSLEEPGCEPGSLRDPEQAAWGCQGPCPSGEHAPAITQGYSLITELEQVYSHELGSTLCVSYPDPSGPTGEGWLGTWGRNCQGSPKWNPADEVDGLPEGDWCSKTNGPATPDCHDAYRSVSYQTFAGAKVKDGTCEL